MGGGGGGELRSSPAAQAAGTAEGAAWGAPGTQGYNAYGGAPIVPAQQVQGAGVQTGIPQGGLDANGNFLPGGFASPAIAQYMQGTGIPELSYNPGQHDAWLGEVAEGTDQGITEFEAVTQSLESQLPDSDDSPSEVLLDPLITDEGTEIIADNAFEQGLGENIVDIINEGGVNPETGDEWISSGPNVLSAADEGAFGIGADYNDEFQENFNAQSDHADNNPTGQSTGTPLYDQGYVGLGVDPVGDFVGSVVNNSTIGTIGSAITGEPLMADLSSLLPPEESFSDYGDDDNDSPPAGIIGDNTSGDNSFAQDWANIFTPDDGTSYVNGVLTYDDDDSSTTDTSSDDGGGWFDSWFSDPADTSSSSSSDSGSSSSSSDSGGGYSCYVATALNDHGYWTTQKKLRLLSWCIKSKPEGKLDTKLWRNGYCWFGKEIIAPRVGHPLIRWLSDGFYESVVEKRITVKSMLGLAFFYIPSYKMGVWKMLRGKLEEIDRT